MSRTTWFALIGAIGLLDWWVAHIKHGDTLSCAVRETFRTETPTGRFALCAAWASLTAWLLPHWCKPVVKAIEEAVS